MPLGYWSVVSTVSKIFEKRSKKMNKLKLAGWILSVPGSILLVLSGSGKVMQTADGVEKMTHIGFMTSSMVGLGVVELLSVVLFLIPQTAFLGAILTSCWMAGAIAAHVRIGEPFVVQLVLGILFWVAYTLRRDDVIKLAFRKSLAVALLVLGTISQPAQAETKKMELKLPSKRTSESMNKPVILINRFTTPMGKQQPFIDAQTAEYKRLDGLVKGSLTVKLHKATDGKTVVNYATFATEEDYHNWVNSELFQDHLSRIKHLVEKAEPALFEVVYEK